MAPKAVVTAERLASAAQRAVDIETAHLEPENRDILLSCTYLGVADASGALAVDACLSTRAKGLFEWTASADCFREVSTVAVQCRDALKEGRSIPFPDSWRFALRCRTLEAIAAKSAKELSARTGLEQLRCQVLGVAKIAAASVSGAAPTIGAEVSLQGPADSTLRCLLCAHVAESTWV